MTDSAGVVRGTFSYDANGNSVGSTGSYSTPLAYAGQYRDAESGLLYLRARYYDPVTVQFLTRDPLVALTLSPFAYVEGNPLNATDQSGLVSRVTAARVLDFAALSQTAQEQYAALNNLLATIFQRQTELETNYSQLSESGKLDHIQTIRDLIQKAWVRLANLRNACAEAASELQSFTEEAASVDLFAAAGLSEPAPAEGAPLDEPVSLPDFPDVPDLPIDLLP